MGIGRDIAYAVGAVAGSPVWATNLLRTGKWRTDWAGKLGKARKQARRQAANSGKLGSSKPHMRGRLLIHAVSVGEVNLVRGLVAELRAEHVEVVIATTTNTGFARATKLYGNGHRVVRYPLDFSFAVERFLDAVRPDAAALVELEVWPNFVEACVRRHIPVAVINGRLSERSFGRYKMVRPLLRSTFAKLATAAVQTQGYAARFRAMGVPSDRVRVLDTMKWDAAKVTPQDHAAVSPEAQTLAMEMNIDRSRPLVVAGSTAPGEEVLLLRALAFWPRGTQLLIAPRKPEWFDQAAQAAPGVVRRTQSAGREPRSADKSNVFLLDTIGELGRAYELADVVVVGRSFVPLFGSDMIEPISLGRPTVIGPHYADFAEVMQAFEEQDGILVTDSTQLAARVERLLQSPAEAAALARRGREVILSRQGATRRHAALLRGLLPATA